MSVNSLSEFSKDIRVSKIERPLESQKVTWIIQGADNSYNWPVIKDEASFTLVFGTGKTATILKFEFQDYTARFNGPTQNSNYFVEKTFLSLQGRLVPVGNNSIKTFEIEVFYTDSETNPLQVVLPKTMFNFAQPIAQIKPNFLLKTCQNISTGPGNLAISPLQFISYPAQIFIALSVTPVQCTTNFKENTNTFVSPIFQDTASLSENFGNFYSKEDNYSDLKIESSDGIVLNAHKFVLAARNGKFHDLMEEQIKENTFDGVIKIKDVKGKPLMIILHWMYTGKLIRDYGNCLEDLVNIAIQYELMDFLKLLDVFLVNMCNPENMLRLFQLAKENKMEVATKLIAEYIKKNIG